MIHLAIQERLDGKTIEWSYKVSDEQYLASRETQFGGYDEPRVESNSLETIQCAD